MKLYKWIPIVFFITSNAFAATYTGTKLKDLNLTTPAEGNTKVSEFNNSDREIKTVILNQYKITAITGTYTCTGTETILIGSSTDSYLLSFPTASSVATGTITKEFVIKNINTGTITLNLNIDGVGSPTITGSQTMCVFTDGTSWFEKRVRTAAVASDSNTLDLLDSTYFTNAANLSTGTVSLDRIPGTLTGKSADLLDEQTGSYYTNASNLDSGTIPLARIPATLTGKDADTIDGINGASIVKTTDDYVSHITAGTGISVTASTGSITVANTGVTQISPGAGISVSNGGVGGVTITASGTSSAGGWTETGTQTIANAGLRILAQGTIAVHASYGITGLLDQWIPNDITIDNLTQVTTRNFSALQGSASDSQVENDITLDNITQITTRNIADLQGKSPYGTITLYATSGTTSSAGVMPFLGSLPTVTDGTEVWTFNYTPSTSTARLDINYTLVVCSTDISKRTIAALYINGATNAVTASMLNTAVSGIANGIITLNYNYLPATTTPWSYAIRLGAGTDTGGAPTVALNSYSVNGTSTVSPLFGNNGCTSTARLTEYIP